jgi:PqqD family protein of HPr-rel-A system
LTQDLTHYAVTPGLLTAALGDLTCLFNPRSQTTHILPDDTLALLETLEAHPGDALSVSHALAVHADASAIEDLPVVVAQRLAELADMGLVVGSMAPAR